MMLRPWQLFALLALVLVGWSAQATAAEDASSRREVTLSTVCLLDGPKYQNRDYVLEATEAACRRPGNDLVVVPYMPFLSYPSDSAADELKDFAELAKEYKTYLAIALTENADQQQYATSVLFDRSGEIVFQARKTHLLPDDDHLAAGNQLEVYEADFGKLGFTIGTDFYFPEIYEVLRMKGAEVLVWQHFPEKLREHRTWEPLLAARALDSHAHFIAAHYAEKKPYLTNHYPSILGSAFGRSMIINRVGIPLADTGIQDGTATAIVDLDHRAGDPTRAREENTFYVKVVNDREAFAPLAEAYQPPKLPQFKKRTARIAIIALNGEHMWRRGERPEKLLEMLDQAASLKPDLILASEQQAYLDDPTVRETMELIPQKARALDAYICIGGIRGDTGGSTAHLWDRSGKLIWKQSIYWPRGIDKVETFDTDFARISAHSCGDLFAPFFDRTAVLKGAELILDPSQMWGPNGATNEKLLRARAADNGVWVACAHWNSSDPGLRSVLIDPYGQVMASSKFQTNDIIFCDIDFDQKRVMYAGSIPSNSGNPKSPLAKYHAQQVPEKKDDWQEMIFSRRRPELYSTLLDENEVLDRYRSGISQKNE